MKTTMRAKMRVAGVKTESYGEVLNFSAVAKSGGYPEDGSDENNTFAKWTPTAEVKMTIQNPDLYGKFTLGQEFYVDFTPAG